MRYIDMHCDTLAKALAQGAPAATKLEGTMVDVQRLAAAGAGAQFFAMFLPQKPEDELMPGMPGNMADGAKSRLPHGLPEAGDTLQARLLERLDGMYRIFRNTLAECSELLAPAYSYCDLVKNRRQGKISAFLTIENGAVVDGRMEQLEKLYGMGVRLVTLTWNDANCFGFPHSAERGRMGLGLTDFGKEAVLAMNRLGMLIDVSHLSDGGFYDVAALTKKPFVASHSNCRELCPATRNLTDGMLKCLAKAGGVAGVNFEPTFLNKSGRESRVECICDHLCHMINVGGVECAGIGTDFDGIGGSFEIADCTQMERLFDALHRRGLPAGAIEKIAYKNVERVIRDSMA